MKSKYLETLVSLAANLWDRRRAFVLAVIAPCFIYSSYLLVLSADRWESVSKVAVKSVAGVDASTFGFGALVGLNPTVREDAMFLKEFIHSHDMLNHLNSGIGVAGLYKGSMLDPFSSLSGGASREDALEYFIDHVEVVLDETSGVLSIKAQGFTPEDALKINKAILSRSESFLNDISNKIARDQVEYLEGQLGRTVRQLAESKAKLLAFQARSKHLDPVKSSEAGAKLVGELTAQLAAQETELTALESYMNEKAPQVVTLRQKVAALRSQINKESVAVTGAKNGTSLNALASDFSDLSVQAELAFEVYKTGLMQLEKSRMDSSRKFKSLVVLSEPNLPDDSTVPNRLYHLLVFLLIALSVYALGRLVWNSIEEHRQ